MATWECKDKKLDLKTGLLYIDSGGYMETLGLNQKRSLPSRLRCKARLHTDGSADCLVDNPVECRYAILAGERFYCKHPERDKILINTRNLQNPI